MVPKSCEARLILQSFIFHVSFQFRKHEDGPHLLCPCPGWGSRSSQGRDLARFGTSLTASGAGRGMFYFATSILGATGLNLAM